MRVAVAGATGAVGIEILHVLEEREFALDDVVLLASARSAGRRLTFAGRPIEVQTLDDFDPAGIDLTFFSAGGSVSLLHARRFVAAGSRVIDNSSAFRMEPDVPLVVPEVNPEALAGDPPLVANPNCSTILFLMATTAIHRAVGIRRAVVATYQAVSGKGARAMSELDAQMRAAVEGTALVADEFPVPILVNCIPHVDSFDDEGHTIEEHKMSRETAKMLGPGAPGVITTCVRVPIPRAHSEAIVLELDGPLAPDEARRLLADFPGVRVVDDPAAGRYPLAADASGADEVLVGRIRRDPTCEHGLALWAVGDQLRKGAALNAVQIAELLARP